MPHSEAGRRTQGCRGRWTQHMHTHTRTSVIMSFNFISFHTRRAAVRSDREHLRPRWVAGLVHTCTDTRVQSQPSSCTSSSHHRAHPAAIIMHISERVVAHKRRNWTQDTGRSRGRPCVRAIKPIGRAEEPRCLRSHLMEASIYATSRPHHSRRIPQSRRESLHPRRCLRVAACCCSWSSCLACGGPSSCVHVAPPAAACRGG